MPRFETIGDQEAVQLVHEIVEGFDERGISSKDAVRLLEDASTVLRVANAIYDFEELEKEAKGRFVP